MKRKVLYNFRIMLHYSHLFMLFALKRHTGNAAQGVYLFLHPFCPLQLRFRSVKRFIGYGFSKSYSQRVIFVFVGFINQVEHFKIGPDAEETSYLI